MIGEKQWPDNITFGEIRYARASNYDGFYLADAAHGIPTFGSVSPSDPVSIRDQHVRVFNYPSQTEEIAKTIVDRWNAHPKLVATLVDLLKPGAVNGAVIERGRDLLAELGHNVRKMEG